MHTITTNTPNRPRLLTKPGGRPTTLVLGVVFLFLVVFFFAEFGAVDVLSTVDYFHHDHHQPSQKELDSDAHHRDTTWSPEAQRQQLARRNRQRRADEEKELLERIDWAQRQQQHHHQGGDGSSIVNGDDDGHHHHHHHEIVQNSVLAVSSFLNCSLFYTTAFAEKQQDHRHDSGKYTADELRTKRQRVRAKWERQPLIPGFVVQILQYKIRVAKKILRGVNAELWKPIHAIARTMMETKRLSQPEQRLNNQNKNKKYSASSSVKSDDAAATASTIQSVPQLFAKDSFMTQCFEDLPECSLWSRPEVMLAIDSGEGPTVAAKKMLSSSSKVGGTAAATNHDLPDDGLQFVDVFFGVKCCTEHAEMRRALKGAYTLFGGQQQQHLANEREEDGNDEQEGGHHRHGQKDDEGRGVSSSWSLPNPVSATMSLTAGSLLATVRDGGYFIPYDTDVDVLIQPKDEKAVASLLKQLVAEQQRQKKLKKNTAGDDDDDDQHHHHLQKNNRVSSSSSSTGWQQKLGISCRLLDPPLEHAHGRLLGFVYGASRIRHEEASRVEIWVALETRKMQKRAIVLPTQRCWLQEVEAECPARPDLVLEAGYGKTWCVPCKARSSNCKNP